MDHRSHRPPPAQDQAVAATPATATRRLYDHDRSVVGGGSPYPALLQPHAAPPSLTGAADVAGAHPSVGQGPGRSLGLGWAEPGYRPPSSYAGHHLPHTQQQQQPRYVLPALPQPAMHSFGAFDPSSYASVSASYQPDYGIYQPSLEVGDNLPLPPSTQYAPLPQHQRQQQHQQQPALPVLLSQQHQSLEQLAARAAQQSHRLELQIAEEYRRAHEADREISRMGLQGFDAQGRPIYDQPMPLDGRRIDSSILYAQDQPQVHALPLPAQNAWHPSAAPAPGSSLPAALNGPNGSLGVGESPVDWAFTGPADMSGLFTALRPATANVDVSPQSPPEQMQWLLGSAAGDFSRPDSGSGPPPSWSTQATVPDFGSSSILPASATSSQADLSVAQPPATSNNGPRKGSARPPSAPGRFTPTPAPTVVESRPATFPRQSGATRKTPAGSVSKAAAKPMSKGKRYLLPGDHIASCVECGSPIAHLQLRGDDEAFAVQWEGVWSCKACLERRGVDTIAQAAEKVKKKRSREMRETNGLIVCDVCFQPRGSGGISAIDGRSAIEFAVEFVCVSCNAKYKRCTDCGGGGGGRVGIGKWRCKELFLPGRKTCRLSHARMGAAPMDLGVWKLEQVGASPVRDEFIRLCEDLWKEKTYTRYAIPEILEAKDGSKRCFADIKEDIDQGWPIKEKLFSSTGSRSTDVVQAYLGLTWSKIKSRKNSDGTELDDQHQPTFLTSEDAPKMRKINALGIIPQGYELGGILFGYWKKWAGTLLLTTFLPFEATNGDDRTFLTIGEFAAQIVPELQAINNQRILAYQQGLLRGPPHLLPYLEHLWVICDNTDPSIKDRMQDLLSRRRQFHTLENYRRLHPTVDPAIFKPDLSYVPKDRDNWVNQQTTNSTYVMARWLGPRLDPKRLEAIFTAEFAKNAKPRKKSVAGPDKQDELKIAGP